MRHPQIFSMQQTDQMKQLFSSSTVRKLGTDQHLDQLSWHLLIATLNLHVDMEMELSECNL